MRTRRAPDSTLARASGTPTTLPPDFDDPSWPAPAEALAAPPPEPRKRHRRSRKPGSDSGGRRPPRPKTLDLAQQIAPVVARLGDRVTVAEVYAATWPDLPSPPHGDAIRVGAALRALGWLPVRGTSGPRSYVRGRARR